MHQNETDEDTIVSISDLLARVQQARTKDRGEVDTLNLYGMA